MNKWDFPQPAQKILPFFIFLNFTRHGLEIRTLVPKCRPAPQGIGSQILSELIAFNSGFQNRSHFRLIGNQQVTRGVKTAGGLS
jgi:hypothetical protein